VSASKQKELISIEEVIELCQMDPLSDLELEEWGYFLRSDTQSLIDQHGKNWVVRYRELLNDQFKFILSM